MPFGTALRIQLMTLWCVSALRFCKYYKGLFLGLLDMALVNAFIIHKDGQKKKSKKMMPHYDFLSTLHTHLINENEPNYTSSAAPQDTKRGVLNAPVQVADGHEGMPRDETRVNTGVERTRLRQCKVCSVYKPGGFKRAGRSIYFCPKCSEGKRGQVNRVSPRAANKATRPSCARRYGTLCGTTARLCQREVEHVTALCKLNTFDLFAYSCSLVCVWWSKSHCIRARRTCAAGRGGGHVVTRATV